MRQTKGRYQRYLVLLVGLMTTMALSGLASSPAPLQVSPAPPAATDRIPNDEPATLYPRWLPESFTPALVANSGTMTVQSNGVIHGAGRDSALQNNVVYFNTRWETREIEGFSKSFVLRSGNNVRAISIAASNGGKVAVGWLETFDNDLFIMQFDPSTGWTSPTTFLGSSIIYGRPSLAYDLQGDLHLAVGRVQAATNVREIVYSENLGAFTVLDSGQPATGAHPLFNSFSAANRAAGPLVEASPTGTPHVSWVRSDNNLQNAGRVMHWTSVNGQADISGSLTDGPGSYDDIGMAIDDQGDAHFVFDTNNAFQYRTRSAGGALSAIEPTPIGRSGLDDLNGFDVDSRREPVVTTRVPGTSQTQVLATRVNNPAWIAQEGSPWVSGVSVPMTGVGGFDRMEIVKGAIHLWTTSFSYARSVEFNLGDQDSFLTFPAGPNASMNAATGNVMFGLPLFTSRGAGISTSMGLTYNSLDPHPGPISTGWTHNYGMSLTKHQGDRYSLRLGDGRTVLFDGSGGAAQDEFGFYWFLVVDGGTGESVLTDKFGTEYAFRDDGKLKEIVDTNGNAITFGYQANTDSTLSEDLVGQPEVLLTSVVDTMTRTTTLTYDSSERLKDISDPAGGTYALIYDGDGALQKVDFASAPGTSDVAWRFEYHSDHSEETITGVPDVFHLKGHLAKIYPPRGNLLSYFHEVFYLRDGRVRVTREPEVEHISEAGVAEDAQAKRIYSYVDLPPLNAQSELNPQETLIRNRRDFDTKIEYEYRRALALKMTDFFDNTILREFEEDPQNPTFLFRNLKRFVDQEGNETK